MLEKSVNITVEYIKAIELEGTLCGQVVSDLVYCFPPSQIARVSRVLQEVVLMSATQRNLLCTRLRSSFNLGEDVPFYSHKMLNDGHNGEYKVSIFKDGSSEPIKTLEGSNAKRFAWHFCIAKDSSCENLLALYEGALRDFKSGDEAP